MTSWVRLSTPFARKIEAKAMALQAIQAALQPHSASPAVLPSAPPATVSVEPWPPSAPVEPMPFERPNITRRPWRVIVDEVAERHGIGVRELLGDARSTRYSIPRQEAMYLLVAQGESFAMVGRKFRRDHTTVLYGCRRHAERAGLPLVESAHGFTPKEPLALPASSDVR